VPRPAVFFAHFDGNRAISSAGDGFPRPGEFSGQDTPLPAGAKVQRKRSSETEQLLTIREYRWSWKHSFSQL